MVYFCNSYPIVAKTAISAGVFSYVIKCPEVAQMAKNGQFVQVKAEGYTLRRPISICQIDKENGTIRLVFEIRGAGTDKISDLNVGDNMDIIAPLGKGFTVPETIPENSKVIVVGGGIGTPPLLGIADKYGDKTIAILGFRSYDKVILNKDYEKMGAKTIICTDDGTVGEKGTIAKPLQDAIDQNNISMIYACGPTPMLKAIVSAAKANGVPCEVSLEQRMGCGVGACVVCACKVIRGGKEFTLRVCKDGPVFKGEEVVL